MTHRTKGSAKILQFWYKGYKLGPAKWRHAYREVWEGTKGEASVSLGHVSFLARQCVSPAREVHPSFRCPKFLLRFRYLGMIYWIIGHVVELSLQPPSLPERLGGQFWQHSAQSLNPLIVQLVLSNLVAYPAPLLKLCLGAHCESPHQYKLKCGPKGPTMNNKRHIYHLESPRVERLPPGKQNKIKQILQYTIVFNKYLWTIKWVN